MTRPPQGHVHLHARPPVGTRARGPGTHRCRSTRSCIARNPTPPVGRNGDSSPSRRRRRGPAGAPAGRPATAARPRRSAAPWWTALLMASWAMRSSCSSASGLRSSDGPASTTSRRSGRSSRAPAPSAPVPSPADSRTDRRSFTVARTSSTAWPTTSRSRAMSSAWSSSRMRRTRSSSKRDVDERLDDAVVQVAREAPTLLVHRQLADALEQPGVVAAPERPPRASRCSASSRSCVDAPAGYDRDQRPGVRHPPSSRRATALVPAAAASSELAAGPPAPSRSRRPPRASGRSRQAERQPRRRAPPSRRAAPRRPTAPRSSRRLSLDLVERRCVESERAGHALGLLRQPVERGVQLAQELDVPALARCAGCVCASTPMTLDSGISAPHASDRSRSRPHRGPCSTTMGTRPAMVAAVRRGRTGRGREGVADLCRDHGREQQERACRPARGQRDRQHRPGPGRRRRGRFAAPGPRRAGAPRATSSDHSAAGAGAGRVGQHERRCGRHGGHAGDGEHPVRAGRDGRGRAPAAKPRRTAPPAGRTPAPHAAPPTSTGRRSTGPGCDGGTRPPSPDDQDRPGRQPVLGQVLDRRGAGVHDHGGEARGRRTASSSSAATSSTTSSGADATHQPHEEGVQLHAGDQRHDAPSPRLTRRRACRAPPRHDELDRPPARTRVPPAGGWRPGPPACRGGARRAPHTRQTRWKCSSGWASSHVVGACSPSRDERTRSSSSISASAR